MPALLHERLTSWASTSPSSTRPGACRRSSQRPRRRRPPAGRSTPLRRAFAPFADRMTPAAIIPMHTPDEAIAELDHVAGARASRWSCCGSLIRPARRRPGRQRRPALARRVGLARRAGPRQRPRLRPGVGAAAPSSACRPRSTWAPGARAAQLAVELRLQPHRPLRPGQRSGVQGAVPGRCDPTVSRGALRVPRRRGGLGVPTLADLVGHWEKRNRAGLEATNPTNLDSPLLVALAASYGDEAVVAVRRGEACPGRGLATPSVASTTSTTSRPAASPTRGHPPAVRRPFLLRLRGRRPHERLGVQPRR